MAGKPRLDASHLHERLRQLRTEKGLTQKQLGKEIGVSASAISSWEREDPDTRKTPSIQMAIVLADYFDVSLDYLLGETRERRTADEISDEALDKVLDSEMKRMVFRGLKELTPHEQRQVYNFIRHVLRGDDNGAARMY